MSNFRNYKNPIGINPLSLSSQNKTNFHLGGNIISDAYNRVVNTLKGPRREAPPYIRKYLESHSNSYIKRIDVCRVPIKQIIDSALNIISLGQYSKIKKQLNYDDMFHLYLLITFDTGESIILERNQVLRLAPATKSDFIELKKCSKSACPGCINIPLNNRRIKFLDFFANGEVYQLTHSDISFYIYDALKNNCQDFVLALLKGNHLDTPFITEYVKQTLPEILPEYAKKFARGLTDVAGAFDVLLHGKGCFSHTDHYLAEERMKGI
jgi:hypothetical protein